MKNNNNGLTSLVDMLCSDRFVDIFDRIAHDDEMSSIFYSNKANVINKPDMYVAEFACPGVGKNDVTVSVEDNNITVEYNVHQSTRNDNEGRYISRSWRTEKFHETFAIPEDVDETQIAANVKDGVLSIVMPKLKKVEKPSNKRSINIE